MTAAMPCWLSALTLTLNLLVLSAREGAALFLPDSNELRQLLSRYQDDQNSTDKTAGSRTRRAIQWTDRGEILQLHNKLRGQVYPTASNMEYMVWDDELERSATHWAEACQWEHGPNDLLMSIGQNLAVHWGRYFTQLVWATTSRVGCAVHVCPRMNVWGEIWENAVYLVCNYSPKGNWIGEAPYQHGRSCSQCPPSYGGSCRDNLCFKGDSQRSETEDMNEVEKAQIPMSPRTTAKPVPRPKPKPAAPNKPSAPKAPTTTFLAQNIKCETKMRDKCKGATCNRFTCPANCQNKKGKVWGTLFYDVQSSICRAAMHYGIINNNGGLVDTTRKDKLPFFVKATKNGIESFSKYKAGNAFVVAKVERQSVDCYATVAEICPFKKPYSNCPRVFCPANCKNEPSYWAPVVGNSFYTERSSICRAATHAGVIQAGGGYVDVLALDKKKSYVGVLKNGIQSESKSNPEGGSFRVFAVRE
ncbi:cysteine-rich secretory protein LCCL domain-containing 2-like [Salvelinus sp. IW2-2015]|uniref:cysteine-rich secretory protein LCCL domain-containing 2-like n=1 Tax=Salvelinus sp. IW2-2015 TaxID=2691554 RepID=UPI0038D4A247